MVERANRRTALKHMSLSLGATLTTGQPRTASDLPRQLIPEGAATLRKLRHRFYKAPRRRDFKNVPMILNRSDQWDYDALNELIAYYGAPRQVWDNTDIGGPWLNLMRDSLNAQIWSFQQPDFLVASATHGLAHLALIGQPTWDRYTLTRLAGDKFKNNALIVEQPAAALGGKDYECADAVFSQCDNNNNIVTPQRRRAVFSSCHNAIRETAKRLIAVGVNSGKFSQEAHAAELTNHLIPGVILTLGAVGTYRDCSMRATPMPSEDLMMFPDRVRIVSRCLSALLMCIMLQAYSVRAQPALPVQRGALPPWRQGENNDAIHRGRESTIAQIDVLADFHGELSHPKLVLFVGGNYFFAVAPLVKRFEPQYSKYGTPRRNRGRNLRAAVAGPASLCIST